MLEEQIEYFRGNKQEFENEKQRRRELILHFSNILGTVDKTRYVLQDDEKPKLENDFESKPIGPLTFEPVKNASALNILGMGESQSYKTKEDAYNLYFAMWNNKRLGEVRDKELGICA